jgi:hypothetical protein
MLRWIARRAGIVAMVLVTLVLAHDLSYIASYGAAYSEAMFRTGHDDRWTAAVIGVSALGLGLVLAAVRRIGRLTQLARVVAAPRSRAERRLGGDADGPEAWSPSSTVATFARHLVRIWPRVAVGGAILFVLQENIERVAGGEPVPGLDVLGSATHPYPIPVLLAVSLAVAAVGALFRSRIAELRTLIARAERTWRRSAHAAPSRPLDFERPAQSILGRRRAVRAPPAIAF